MQVHIPHLEANAVSKQLIVNGKPFLMLAGELQNSSLTSAKYMREAWPKLKAANINTLLGCVTWEQIEPTEGTFDFVQLNEVISDARSHDLHLVLLWFGSFKNGLSSYAPPWVKQDNKRFPRAKLRKAGGELKTADVISIFHNETKKCDARAFQKLMAHVKEVDEKHQTVIMVQVENETGLLGDSRDGGSAAEKCFQSGVPSELLDQLSSQWDSLRPELQKNLSTFNAKQAKNASWTDTFGRGPQTDELFMAYHYAKYLEEVASAGKAAYPLPLYTNVWMNYVGNDADNDFPVVAGGGGTPGDYPSGGGVPDVIDIWQMFAPSLDFIAPDVYLNDYASSCAKYRHRKQPLFIPEQRRDEYGARRIWTAYGSYQALGTSPFGIDTLEAETNPIRQHYGLLASVSTHVLEAQRNNSSVGFFFDELTGVDGTIDTSPSVTAQFGPWKLTIQRSFVFGKPGPGSGMAIHKGGNQFLLLGWGFQVLFKHETAPYTSILRFEEKEVDPETQELKTLRMLNGDETRSGLFCIMPSSSPDYGGFPICVTIPARTAIAIAEPYALEDFEDCV
ncbi:hypothetical protein LTS10_011396 [Elasticomyces elasticus]|nr:hypothetical protein LTS10_011396 [Elasticomyces elasticus]